MRDSPKFLRDLRWHFPQLVFEILGRPLAQDVGSQDVRHFRAKQLLLRHACRHLQGHLDHFAHLHQRRAVRLLAAVHLRRILGDESWRWLLRAGLSDGSIATAQPLPPTIFPNLRTCEVTTTVCPPPLHHVPVFPPPHEAASASILSCNADCAVQDTSIG